MIADSTFHAFIPQDLTDALRSIGNEFAEAELQNKVSESLGRKYLKALNAYGNALHEVPWAPGNAILGPTAHDAMMRQKIEAELLRIQNEVSGILNHFGGALSLVDDED